MISIFHGLNLEDVKRFEDIINSDNVLNDIRTTGLYTSNQYFRIEIIIKLIGIDGKTGFNTKFNCYEETVQLAIAKFLEWWDREIVRFNSFNQLTKSGKK